MKPFHILFLFLCKLFNIITNNNITKGAESFQVWLHNDFPIIPSIFLFNYECERWNLDRWILYIVYNQQLQQLNYKIVAQR